MFSALALAAQLAACPVQDQVLESAAARIEATYVDPGQAAVIASAVRGWAREGRYAAACAAPEDFVAQFNRDLDAYDGHFHFEQAQDAASSEDWLMQWRAGAPTSNAGLREVRVLEGNVGYIRLTTFYSWDLAGEKLGHAWALIKDTSGLILDLRQNGGGDDATPAHIVKSLLGPGVDAVQDIDRRTGQSADPLPQATLPYYAAPVVVLIDRRSASAAEYVAYALQAYGRATVIGSRSAGGAHMLGDPVPIGHGFQFAVPEARPLNRKTGGNWEQVGVKPDVPGGDDPLFNARLHLSKMDKDSATPRAR